MYIPVTQETLDLIKAAMQNPMAADPNKLAKAFTQATGLVFYDLQAPALKLYPVLTPLRNRIPRVGGDGGTATNWKAITGINTGGMSAGVGEGARGGIIVTSLVDKVAAYKTLGLEDYVTFQADWAAKNFDDAKARSVEGLLRSLMIAEEKCDWGGNASLALGTTPTPAVTASDTGGGLATAVWSVICVALTPEGYYNSSVAAGLPGQITRTNADGSIAVYGGGNAKKSIAATGEVTTGSVGSLACTVAAVNGAAAYAWFWGAAGSEKLGAITTINSIKIIAAAAGTQGPDTVAGADYSTNSLVYDGILTQLFTTGSGAYIRVLATGTAGTGTPLTTNGMGGIAELDTAFQSFWDNYRLSPEEIWCSAQELMNMNKLVVANGGAPLIRFNLDANSPNPVIDAGVVIGSILNPITNTKVAIAVHPNAVPGTILLYSNRVPYSLSNVGNLIQKKLRMDYYQIEWPLRTLKYEYGIYADGLLQMYFPPAYGVITNIAPPA